MLCSECLEALSEKVTTDLACLAGKVGIRTKMMHIIVRWLQILLVTEREEPLSLIAFPGWCHYIITRHNIAHFYSNKNPNLV